MIVITSAYDVHTQRLKRKDVSVVRLPVVDDVKKNTTYSPVFCHISCLLIIKTRTVRVRTSGRPDTTATDRN